MKAAPAWKLVVLKREERCGGCGELIQPGTRYNLVRVWRFPGRLMVRCMTCGVRHVKTVDRRTWQRS
jgi:hypothetical protein